MKQSFCRVDHPLDRSVCEHSHSMGLFELADLLDLVHKISSINILHDEVQPVLEAVIERQDR